MEIIVAVITGGISLVGTIITVLAANKKTMQDFRVTQAVTTTKLDTLAEEVRTHNNFARRLPIVETKLEDVTRRIDDLEEAIKK